MQITQSQIIDALNSKLENYRPLVSVEVVGKAGFSSLKDFLFNAIISASPVGKMLITDLSKEFHTEPHTLLRVLFSKP